MSDVGEHVIDTGADEVAAASRVRAASAAEVIGLYVASILGALMLAGVLVEATGGSWSDVYRAMIDGSVRRPGRWGGTLGVAAPVLLVALGTIVSGRAGLVNIGQEGQLVMGAVFAGFVGVRLGGPGPLVLVALCIAGVVGGAIWAGIAGVLRFRRNVPEVLTTLLLGATAASILGFGLRYTWLLLAPPDERLSRNQVGSQLDADTRIPRVTLFGNEFPISVFIAVAIALVLAVALSRTVAGFRLAMVGRNPRTAQRAGVSQARYGTAALLISGGLAGLAGSLMLAGGDFGSYQLVANFGAGIGFAGLLAALVARQRVIVAVFVAFVFGCLRTGSNFLKAGGLSARIADVVQGLLVLAMLLPPAILYLRQRRRAMALSRARV
jgi:general nucleoside transport system permease protein